MIQQVGGAVSNLTDGLTEGLTVEPAFGFGLDGPDQEPELLRKREDSLLEVIACRPW